MHPPPLFAFGFESLPMLGWLAAAAAPWLIHLFSRRKYRETAWAAMDFLLAAVKRRTRRIRIEQWLLLLVRTLVIVALVTAVAEPYLEHAMPVFSPNGSTHHVLVIDSSYSMAYKAADRTRFEEAKQWAARIVEQSSRGDGFTLVQMASPPRVIVATPGLEKEPICQEIQNLELLHTGADLAATLAEVRKVLDTARRDSPRLARHEVCFLTDLQRGTWMPATDAAKTDVRSRAEGLASIAQLQVINLGQTGDDNLAITSLDLRDPRVLAGRSTVLEASVRDFGHVGRQHQAVDLLVDGHPAGRQYVDIPAGGNAVVRFHHGFESAGDHAVEVCLAGGPLKPGDVRGPADALEVDNHRYLAVNVRQAVRVLCVDGRPAGDPQKTSVFNLTLALSSRSDPNSRSPIDFDVAAESAVLERDLAHYDCVMLSNVAQFTASEARVLDNYLIHGGSLVFFLGDRVIADNYNNLLAGQASEGSRPILPARLIAVAENPGGRLDPLDYRNPIVQKFRGQEKTGLLQSPVAKYFKVRLLDSVPGVPGQAADRGATRPATVKGENRSPQAIGRPPAVVVLALSNGDPLIVAQPIRRGRVVVVTTSADTSWGPLPLWGTYEPLVKEILAWCTAGQARGRNIEVGGPLEGALAAAPALMDVSIECPGGQRRTAPLEIQGDYRTWRYDETLTSGFYTAHLASPLLQSQLFAVNLVTAESDLASISQDELQNEVWPGIPLGYETAWQGEGMPILSRAGPSGQLHVGLLYAVVVLLLVESLLAWRFGYNAR
ncbi:MAG: BatA domain-containing protein [Thermoguttaceae bacterium]